MMFKQYKVYENKLSEQISDSNPLKKKLIEMETPTDNHPIYSFLSIGLLIYVWMFLTALLYKKAYGYEEGIVVVVFTTICFMITYKKPYLIGLDSKYRRNANIIFLLTILLSIFVELPDKGELLFKDMGKIFFFFSEINNKSYIALSILSFLMLGISLCYVSCPYYMYRGFYSVNRTYGTHKTEESLMYKYSDLSFISIIVFIPCVYGAFNPAEDGFASKLKLLSMMGILAMPLLFYNTSGAKKYIKVFKKAKELDVKSNEGNTNVK